MALRLSEADAMSLVGETATGRSRHRGKNPESAIQAAILDWLSIRGILAWRINAGAVKTASGGLFRGAPAGHPDIAGVLPGGHAFYIEVKCPGKRPTPAQVAFHAQVRAAGALVMVATCIEDVETHLHLDWEAFR